MSLKVLHRNVCTGYSVRLPCHLYPEILIAVGLTMCMSFPVLSESDRATLPVIATVFDKLNHEYKKYLDAEQSYTMVS